MKLKLMLCKRGTFIGRGQCSWHVWESKYSMFDPQRPTYKTCYTSVINIVNIIATTITTITTIIIIIIIIVSTEPPLVPNTSCKALC